MVAVEDKGVAAWAAWARHRACLTHLLVLAEGRGSDGPSGTRSAFWGGCVTPQPGSPPAPPPRVLFQGGLLSHPPPEEETPGAGVGCGPCFLGGFSIRGPPPVGCLPQQEPGGGRGRLLTSSGACGVRAARTPWLCPLTLWRALRAPGWCSQNRLVCVLFVSRGEHTAPQFGLSSAVFKPKLKAPPAPKPVPGG